MSRMVFNLAARCDAAGRSQNQDNYWVCPDLTKWNAPIDKIVGTDEDVELSDKGALLVVADGMGGMNAGEVASRLVIEGIKKKFSSIPDSILASEPEIQKFIYDAIVESDELIKKYAKDHKDAEGLGSTIVLLWLLNGKAFCGWCGDSRIYRFNPNNELVRLSHDHSYVQSLVDEGKILEDEAFEHPDGNIISKALGDNGNKAEPELRTYDIYQRDVFMLCSDGLCGLLQDNEINDVISNDCTSSKDTLKSLWEKGEQKGWSDNATIDVLCIVDGGKPAKGRPDGYPIVVKKSVKKNLNKPQIVSGGENVFAKILKPPYLYIIAIITIALLGLALYNAFGEKEAEGSTNHEYSIEVPNNVDSANDVDNSDNSATGGNQNTSTQGGRHGANTGTVNGGRQTGAPGRQTGMQGNTGGNTQNQGNQSSNNSGNSISHPNGGNGGINQGVIDQLNQNNNSTGGQNTQPAEVYPSQGYLQLLKTVKNDFNNANSAYSTVKSKGWRSKATDQTIAHYMNNIDNNLRSLNSDSKNFNALSANQKASIESFARLAADIDRYYYNYPTTPPRNLHNNDSYGDDDIYGGGRSL